MTLPAQPGARIVSTACGLSMVAAVAVGAHRLALVAVALGVAAVLAGAAFRPAATLAVLFTATVIAVSHPSPVLAALSGLSAAAYLVLRYVVDAPAAVVTGGWPTVIAAVAFTFAGLIAASFPLQLPWLPLLAPPAVFAIYVLATRPFMG